MSGATAQLYEAVIAGVIDSMRESVQQEGIEETLCDQLLQA